MAASLYGIMNKKWHRYHFYTYAIMLYFLIAPLRDVLAGDNGTLSKYVIALIVLVGLLESAHDFRLKFDRFNVPILYLMALSTVSCLWAYSSETALDSLVVYLYLPGMALFFSCLQYEQREYNAIAIAAVIGGVIATIYLLISGNGDYQGHGRLTYGAANDPNNLAGFLLVPLVLLLRKVESSKGVPRITSIAAMIVLLYAIFMTGSRGALLGFVVALVSFLFLKRFYRNAAIVVALVAVLTVVWFVIVPILPDDIRMRLFTVEGFTNALYTQGQRGELWNVALNMVIPNQPLWGYGTDCGHYLIGVNYGSVMDVHNLYLNMIIEYGLLGLPVFLYFLWVNLRECYRGGKNVEIALLLGTLTVAFFLDAYEKQFFWNAIYLATISRAIVLPGSQNRNAPSKGKRYPAIYD